MLTSSTTSSYSSSVSSSEPHLPYTHPQPPSSLSLASQAPRRTMPRTRRFYSSPMDEDANTPLQRYGYEQREPSIMEEKPKLFRRMSHALDDIKEDFSLQLNDPASTANKIKRRSTLYLSDTLSASPRPDTSDGGPPRSRPMSIISFDAWSQPQRNFGRRLSRRLSVFSLSGRGKGPGGSQAASISSPNLIGSSTQYGPGRASGTFL